MYVISSWSRSFGKLHFRPLSSPNFSATRSLYWSFALWVICTRPRCDFDVFFVFNSRNCYTSFSVIFQLICTWPWGIAFIHFMSWTGSNFNDSFFWIIFSIIGSRPRGEGITNEFSFSPSNLGSWHGSFGDTLILSWPRDHGVCSNGLIGFLTQCDTFRVGKVWIIIVVAWTRDILSFTDSAFLSTTKRVMRTCRLWSNVLSVTSWSGDVLLDL